MNKWTNLECKYANYALFMSKRLDPVLDPNPDRQALDEDPYTDKHSTIRQI
jgi:hypothetical protein